MRSTSLDEVPVDGEDHVQLGQKKQHCSSRECRSGEFGGGPVVGLDTCVMALSTAGGRGGPRLPHARRPDAGEQRPPHAGTCSEDALCMTATTSTCPLSVPAFLLSWCRRGYISCRLFPLLPPFPLVVIPGSCSVRVSGRPRLSTAFLPLSCRPPPAVSSPHQSSTERGVGEPGRTGKNIKQKPTWGLARAGPGPKAPSTATTALPFFWRRLEQALFASPTSTAAVIVSAPLRTPSVDGVSPPPSSFSLINLPPRSPPSFSLLVLPPRFPSPLSTRSAARTLPR